MDQITRGIRLNHWKEIVAACQSRPDHMSQKEWLANNDIDEKQYYYWQRRVREDAYAAMMTDQPSQIAVKHSEATSVTFAEIQTPDQTPEQPKSDFHADAVIQFVRGSVALSNSVSPELLHMIVEELNHAS